MLCSNKLFSWIYIESPLLFRVEYNMLVPDEYRKCVVFICFRDQYGVHHQAGTGFFVGIPIIQLNIQFIYLVTAKHVIVDLKRDSIDGKVYLRMNLIEGGVEFVEKNIEDWVDHPSDTSVDVMTIMFAPNMNIFDYRIFPISHAVTSEMIEKENIGVGDDVFLTGLFVNHVGKNRNLPIVRSGNIALMPEERVSTKHFGSIEAYLIESRSIGGLSGSPVFVHKPYIRIRNGNLEYSNTDEGIIRWLGVMHGHWELSNSMEDYITEDLSKRESVNLGIAIVVPAEKVLEVINQPKFENIRKGIIELEEQKQISTKQDIEPKNTEGGL